MRKTKKPPEEKNRLVARIEDFEMYYYLSTPERIVGSVTDEARIDIATRIVSIVPKLKRFADLPFEVSLAVDRSFAQNEQTAPSDRPILLPVALTKREGACLAYTPADALWEIPRLIDAGRFTHIDVGFGTLHSGRADLTHLYFCREARLEPF